MIHKKQKTPTKRILSIVKRLYAFETLQSSILSKEYEVSTRTIHRDMMKIAETIPLINDLGVWHVDEQYSSPAHNNFHQTLLSAFAHNLDIDMECLEQSNISKENVAYAVEYKYLPKKLGEQVLTCVQSEEQCSFTYIKEDSTSQRQVDPIKIYTENARWYMIARDYKDDKVKYFNLAKIKSFKHLKTQKTTLTQEMLDEANDMKSIWSSKSEKEILVRLYVKPDAASYVKDIKLHKSQVIYDEHYDGGLEVHCTITHKLELLPQIKYWIPRIYVIEPRWLHDELMRDLENYRDECDKFDI